MKRAELKIFTSYWSLILIMMLIYANAVQAQNIYLSEFMASNTTSYPDIIDFDDYSDWLEIFNDETHSVDIGGYYLTDDLNNPMKWQIPEGTVIQAKQAILFWADGYDVARGTVHARTAEPWGDFIAQRNHLNFKLSIGGEELGIADINGTLIDSLVFGLQYSDVSYGRIPQNSDDWYYFGDPSPGVRNSTDGTINTEFAGNADASPGSGWYTGSVNVTLSANSPSAIIYYTTDGSRPTVHSEQYNNSITVGETSVLRTRVYDGDKLPGPIVTNTYFIDEDQNIPVLSITAFPETMFGNNGIYSRRLKQREIPANIEYFEADGTPAFSIDLGLRLSGQASFNYPQKPLTLEADERFGSEFIEHKIFEGRELNKFSSIYLRNSGTPDIWHTMFRDALQHTLVINQMDLDLQAYQPAATYINGQYWGIYNIREKIGADYFAAHHNVDPTNLDLLEYDFSPVPVVEEGDAVEYNELVNFLQNNNLGIQANYDYVKSKVDIDEFINYQITEIYCDNINWPYTNSRWWRERVEGGKWRYILLDLDYGFGQPSWYGHYTNNTFGVATSYQGTPSAGYPSSTLLFRSLLQNQDFFNEFIQRFASHINTTFKASRVLGIIDSLEAQIDAEMRQHIGRWRNDYTVPIYDDIPIQSYNEWKQEVAVMKEFGRERPQWMKQHVYEAFGITGVSTLTINITEPNSGKVLVNSVEMVDGFEGEYFRGIPVTLEAVPAPGYRFARWIGASISTPDSFQVTLPIDKEFTAVFEPDDISLIPATVSSNLILDQAGSPYYAEGNIIVDSAVTLTVMQGVEILMSANSSIIVNGVIEMTGTEEEPIVIKPNGGSGFANWGALCITDGTGLSTVTHVRLEGATNGPDKINQVGAISGYKSDITMDNITIEDAPFPIFTQYGNIILRNSTLHSEKTCDLINVKYAGYALVENCDMRGNHSFDTDAIDYDQIDGGIIRNNRIYNFFGFNSDGIDLGEGSKNILIENNLILNCNDKGVSVGQASTTILQGNIIVNCAQGVGVKDFDSYAYVDGNVFYGCGYSVASFEKNYGAGGGNVDVVNSIIAKPQIESFLLDDLSTLTFSYSLSDSEELPGTGNILADPLFTNEFRLSANSPAINTGSPDSPTDPDGSRKDIGKYPYNAGDQFTVYINEIHYNPSDGEEFEFIELYNSGDAIVDLSGYIFVDGIDFEFPEGVTIGSNDFIVIAKNSANYSNQGYPVFQWNEGSLNDIWSNIEIHNSSGDVIDLVSYSKIDGWPAPASGQGYSAELSSPDLENMFTSNWQKSFLLGGSPGANNRKSYSDLIYINELLAANLSVNQDEYGEYNDWIEIYNAGQQTIDLDGLYITDNFNNLTKFKLRSASTGDLNIYPGEHILLWADQETDQGPRHLSFRLNRDEELALVYIFANDTTIVDSVSFTDQENNFSWARETDAGDLWHIVKRPTPNLPNSIPGIFEKGILLVNGLALRTDEVVDAYESKAFWGDYPIDFWDTMAEPIRGYPSTLPEPLGHGALDVDVLKDYSSIIWLSNGSGTDLAMWNQSPMDIYLQGGGNLLLMSTRGQSIINGVFEENLGVSWMEPQFAQFDQCVAVYPGLVDLHIDGLQITNAIFNTALTNRESTLLFAESSSFDDTVGIGVWQRPALGGWYSEDGGQFVFISGRPHRYNYVDLKQNVGFILREFFNEPEVSDTNEPDNTGIVKEYSLNQNYPNPFNPSTTIKFDLVEEADVKLSIFNILGEEVRKLVDDRETAGRKSVIWDGKDNSGMHVGSGVYIYRMIAQSTGTNFTWTDSKKMLLLR